MLRFRCILLGIKEILTLGFAEHLFTVMQMALNSKFGGDKKLLRPPRLFWKLLMIRCIIEKSPFPNWSSQFEVFQEFSAINPNVKSSEIFTRVCSVKTLCLGRCLFVILLKQKLWMLSCEFYKIFWNAYM